MTLNPTNFKVLEDDFGDIIIQILDTDGERKSSGITQRKTIKFTDGSYIRVREHLKQNKIDHYYYDWFDAEQNELLKFHSEIHDEDRRYQTDTEPFHIHIPEKLRLSSMTRFPNHNLRELYAIMEFVRLHFTLMKYNK